MVARFSDVVGALRARRSRPKAPERLDARGWDLFLLGLVLFSAMLGIAFAVTRYANG